MKSKLIFSFILLNLIVTSVFSELIKNTGEWEVGVKINPYIGDPNNSYTAIGIKSYLAKVDEWLVYYDPDWGRNITVGNSRNITRREGYSYRVSNYDEATPTHGGEIYLAKIYKLTKSIKPKIGISTGYYYDRYEDAGLGLYGVLGGKAGFIDVRENFKSNLFVLNPTLNISFFDIIEIYGGVGFYKFYHYSWLKFYTARPDLAYVVDQKGFEYKTNVFLAMAGLKIGIPIKDFRISIDGRGTENGPIEIAFFTMDISYKFGNKKKQK